MATQYETLAPAYINKHLTEILFYFMGYYGESTQLEMELTSLRDCFPIELLPNGLTQEQAIVNFFNNRNLVVLGSTSLNKVLIRGKLCSLLTSESRIV
jgi:hypothetical protein